jgi:Kef-type K+ transport system membrane component KefB
MVIGCLCGPYVLNMVTTEELPRLSYVTQVALSFIAFSAGGELYLPELRSLLKIILTITGLNALFSYVLMTLFIYLLAVTNVVSWMHVYVPGGCAFTISLIAGSIMVARSPASAIAVVRELKAKGPVTSTMLGVTVVGDVVVLVLFTLSSSIALAVCSGAGFEGGAFIVTLITLVAAVGIGYLLGFFMIFLLWLPRNGGKYTIIPLGFITFVLCDWFAIYSIKNWGVSINFDALLVCITAGYVVTNQSRNRIAFLKLLGSSATYIFIPFFTKVGVELNLPIFYKSLGFAVLVFLARAACIFLGSFTGARITGMDFSKQKTLWMTMLAQAGVSLGLASEVRVKFPEWGGNFQTSIIAVVLINQFVGPVACKWALRYHGEAGKMVEGEEDEHEHGAEGVKKVKRAVIVGVDALSIATAQRLLNDSWAVTLLDKNKKNLDSLVKKLVVEKPDLEVKSPKNSSKTNESHEEKLIPEGNINSEEYSQVSSTETENLAPHSSLQLSPSTNNDNTNASGRVIEPRLIAKHIPTDTGRSLSEVISSLLPGESSASTVEGCIVQLDNDEESYTVALHLLEVRHIHNVIQRVFNPSWGQTLSNHGIMPFYPVSFASQTLQRAVMCKNAKNLFPVSDSGKANSLPETFQSFLHPEDDFAFNLLTLPAEERKDYADLHAAPSTEIQLAKLADLAKVLAGQAVTRGVEFGTVAESQKGRYMHELLQSHNVEHIHDETETEAESAMMLGPSGQRNADAKKKQDEQEAQQQQQDL